MSSGDISKLDLALAEEIKGQIVCFGDQIKIFVKTAYLKTAIPGTFDPEHKDGGYVGVYEKLDRTTRVVVPPIGIHAQGTFRESVFRVEDARTNDQPRSAGTRVRYGDPVILVDESTNYVWNNKIGGFFEAYLGLRPRGSPGELYISFQKNGRDREPMMFGDVGVYIDVEDSHRYRVSFNQRLTNFKTSSSRVIGGYVCSDGSGTELFVQIHRHTGAPVPRLLSRQSSARRRNAGSISSRYLPTTKIETIAVTTVRGSSDEDVVIVNPPNKHPVKVFGVKPDSLVLFRLSGDLCVSVKASSLAKPQQTIPIPRKEGGGDAPAMALKLTHSIAEEESVTSGTSSSDKHANSMLDWVRLALELVKLVLVYSAITFFFPGLMITVRPVLKRQLHVVAPIVDKVLGPGMTHGLADHVDGAIAYAFPDDYDSFKDIHVVSVMVGITLCFMMGLFSPSFLRDFTSRHHRGATTSSESKGECWIVTPDLVLQEGSDAMVVHTGDHHGVDATGEGDFIRQEDIIEEEEQVRGAYVAAGYTDDGIPKHPAWIRFLNGEMGNVPRALKRWKITAEWRFEGGIDSILDQPHPKFDVIKRNYPHYYIGRGRLGNPIYLDQPGGVKMKNMKKAGVKLKDLVFHFLYITEFLWNEIEPSEDGRTITILDLNGIGMFDFVGEVVDFVKKASAISQEHYPERSLKVYIVNAPRFFSGIWHMIKPLLAEQTVQKISINRTAPTQDMLKDIDENVLPAIYGGKNDTDLAQSLEEKRLRNNVYRELIKSGVRLIGDDGTYNESINLKDAIDIDVPGSIRGKKHQAPHAAPQADIKQVTHTEPVLPSQMTSNATLMEESVPSLNAMGDSTATLMDE